MAEVPPGARLVIPRGDLPPLRFLATLPSDTYSTLVAVFQEPISSRGALIARVAGALGSSAGSAESVVDVLLRASFVLTFQQTSTADLVSAAVAVEDLRLGEEERSTLTTRLSELLESTAVGLLAKTIDLLTDNERLFLEARIVTDIRPIFSGELRPEEPTGQSLAYVIQHTLRIFFQTPGSEDRSAFFVTLDDADLRKLDLAVQRANWKAKRLAETISGLGPLMSLQDEESN